MTKRCASCRTEKRVTEFCRNQQNRDGLTSYCKDCLPGADYIPEMRPNCLPAEPGPGWERLCWLREIDEWLQPLTEEHHRRDDEDAARWLHQFDQR